MRAMRNLCLWASIMPALLFGCSSGDAPTDAAPEPAASDGGVRPEPDQTGTGDSGPSALASCALQSFPAAKTRCSTPALSCLAAATSKAELDKCWSTYPDCASCLDDEYDHCVVGEPSAPGRCAKLYGCLYGCVTKACGASPSDACRDQANKGACAKEYQAFDTCYDFSAPENKACGDQAERVCGFRVCGNKVVETGETCDGNCPASCPTPTDPCETVALVGSASTCDVRCVTSKNPSCTGCPSNPVSSDKLGSAVFSGEFFKAKDWFTGGSCGQAGPDAVHAWHAPTDGVYDFWLSSLGTFAYFGKSITRTFSMGNLDILSGSKCGTGLTSLGCKAGGGKAANVRLTLKTGQDVLIVASRLLDTDSSDGIFDISAPYDISIIKCVPNCTGKNCGDDGCGGSCGTCSLPSTCSASGKCTCTPQCWSKQCGPDGCGGSCGSCSPGSTCTSSGQCSCTPQCAGKQCGGDGCGGSCGTCKLGQTCSAGSCVTCTPQCAGKVCGGDGCGGSCGSCKLGETCSGGICVPNPVSCDPVDNTGCSYPNECALLSNETSTCILMGSGTQGSYCSSTSSCAGGYGCFANTCRKICTKSTGDGCAFGEVCNGVTGWFKFGACAKAP